jgi:WD40 repeat protein
LHELKLISRVVQLAWGKAHVNPKELVFQMYGRLFAQRSELAAVEKYVSSVEMHAERPLLRSIDPFLGQPGGPLIASFSVGFDVCSVVFLPGSGRVLAAGDGGNMVIAVTDAGGIVQALEGYEGRVNAIAVCADGSRIVSGCADGTVRIWDTASGEAVGEPLRGHKGDVSSVALARTGCASCQAATMA